MNNYIQVLFPSVSQEEAELLIAALNEAGFEGFEEEESRLKAFIRMNEFEEYRVREIAAGTDYVVSVIEETNWNQVWESNFHPVVVDDFVAIRADFHEPVAGTEHEIIITPKMSFGTGHHATTWLMIQQMRDLDCEGKSVLDFGTGTGVLAILAKKLGAERVTAIDHDEWSIINAGENIERNDAGMIVLLRADSADRKDEFDIILANINKNVILDNLDALKDQLLPDGILLLSGLLAQDEEEVVMAAGAHGLKVSYKAERDNWLLLRLSY